MPNSNIGSKVLLLYSLAASAMGCSFHPKTHEFEFFGYKVTATHEGPDYSGNFLYITMESPRARINRIVGHQVSDREFERIVPGHVGDEVRVTKADGSECRVRFYYKSPQNVEYCSPEDAEIASNLLKGAVDQSHPSDNH